MMDNNRHTRLPNQIPNRGGGYSFSLCDMQRLERFIVLGSEENTYYTTSKQLTLENVICVRRLLDKNHFKEVLDKIEDFSSSGRVSKEDPVLTVLAICSLYSTGVDLDNREKDRCRVVQKASYEKLNSICNIPTKLFRFLELTHDEIVRKRIADPPVPQPASNKRKRVDEKISELIIDEKSENVAVESDSDISVVSPTKKTKKEHLKFKKVNKVARKSLGWGRMRRNGIANFYTDDKKDACRLLYLMTKYKQRSNWSHKQVLGYAHPKMKGEHRDAKNLVLKYCTRGYEKIIKEAEELQKKPGISEHMSEVINYINIVNEVCNLSPDKEGDEEKLIECLMKYGVRDKKKEYCVLEFGRSEPKPNTDGKKSPIHIVREHIPTGFLKCKKVWELLLADMPMTAMIRNLGKMSSLNMFGENSPNTNIVVDALEDVKRLKAARIHPMKLLIAMQVYTQGKGDKGDLTWNVNDNVVKALDSAFYKSFKSPELNQTFKTGKKYMLCLDVSGSMTFQGCVGTRSITPAMASTAMAMVTWHIEDNVEIMAFGSYLQSMKEMLQKDMLINDAMRVGGSISFGATDCSLPMINALEEKMEVDVFIVYTDSETNSGRMQPVEALRQYNNWYREEHNGVAKLIVCGMNSNGFTIADPNDKNMLDVVGFDTNVPEILSSFVQGNYDSVCNVCEECVNRQQGN